MLNQVPVSADFAAGASVSGVLDMRTWVAGVAHAPRNWTSASLGFKVAPVNIEQITLATLAGAATSFSQPDSATVLEVVQAAHVAGDVGRGIVVVGSDDTGAVITETISLHATNTTTAVAGTTEFTKVAGVYTADGAVLGAQDVTVRPSGGGATVVTFTASTASVGMATVTASAANGAEVVVTGPNADETYVTVIGTLSGDVVGQRVQLDGSSPSVIYSDQRYDEVTHVAVGELTNAVAATVKSRDWWQPLYDDLGSIVAITITAGTSFDLPEAIDKAGFVKLWSHNGSGTAVAQTEARRVWIELKG